jgi:hypothetical protein
VVTEAGKLQMAAKDGKADLSKIQVESVIVYLVKQKPTASRIDQHQRVREVLPMPVNYLLAILRT